MATRARLFSQGVGGAGGNAATVSSLLPYLTTANVAELAPNVYYSNVRAFANLQLASLNDLYDVTYFSNTGIGLVDLRANGFPLVWSGTTWIPANAISTLGSSTTDDLREGNINLYYTNARARTALTAGDQTIIINAVTGTIRANVNYFSSTAGNTTDGLPEGLQNLYYTDARAHANIKNASIFALRDVNYYDPGSGPVIPSDGQTLVYDALTNFFIPGYATTALADHANTAGEANVVLSIGNFVTANLTEFGNLYFTNERVYSNVANMSLDVLRDVWTPANTKITGYVLTWDGNNWMPRDVANIGNVGSSTSSLFATNARFANVAGFANVASNAYYANVAGRTNFATLSNIANVSIWSSYAEVANTVLNVGFAANAGQVQNLDNFTSDDLREGNTHLYYSDQRVLANVSSMYLDTLYNVSVSNAQVNEVLIYDGTNWIPGSSVGSAGFAQNAAFANVANTVLSLAGHTTDEIIEGTNVYYTIDRLTNDIQSAILNKDIELDDLIVNGDLTVNGNDVTLNVANLKSQSKTLVLNNGGSGGAGSEGAGLYVAGANVSLRYSETNNGFGMFGNLTVAGDILPAISGRFNLGGPGKLWRGIYIGAQTIYLGNTAISEGTGTSGGLSIKDQYGNEAAVSLANISGTQYVTINRVLGNVTPETEFNGYIGGNVNQFTSGKTGNIYFGILKDGDFNKFAGMRVVETYDNSPNLRSDLYFYTDRESFANSTASLGLLGTGNLAYRGNLITINNIRVIDNRGNFVGNTFLGTRDVDITHGGTGANTTQDARRNLFGDMTGGLVAKIFGSNTLTPISLVGGTGVTVTDGDAQGGAPTIAIGQPVATTDSVTFKNVSVTANLTVYGDLTTFGANNLRVSDNMIYINHGANSAANPDLGIVWAFNPEGADPYQHGGLFRDATDGRIKFFQNYTLEPDANIFINTSDASFQFANLQAESFIGNVVGTVSSIANHTTDSLAEGNTNRYYTNARVVQTVTPLLNTSNVVEGTNLYFTNARVITALTAFLTTANVTESASNLYFTNARVLAALATSNVQVNNLTVGGDLIVQGNTVTLNTATLVIEDKNIILANGSVNAAAADGAGFSIQGANANLTYLSTGDKFELNKNLSVLGNINLTGLFTSENFAANNIVANTLAVSGNVTFGTGTGGTLTGLAYAYATNVVANLITTDVLVANVIRATRVTGNLVVDNKIFANGLILQNIDVTDTVISGNITGGGGSTFNTVSANVITTGTLNVTSNIVTLLSGVTGASTSNASIAVNRGTNADVALRWEEEIDRWQFTNDGTSYYPIPVPDEYSNVTYDISVQSGANSRKANLRLQGTHLGNVVVSDTIEVIGTGLVSVQRTSADQITIDAGIAPVSVLGVNNSSYVEITRFDISTYRTAKYVYTVTTTAYVSGGPHFASGEILVMHDGANVFESQYGMILSGHDEIVTFQTSINNSNVILSAKTTDSGTIATVKLSGTTYTEV